MKKFRFTAVMLIIAVILTSSAAYASFSDVGEGHWAYKYVNELAEKNIIGGVGDNMYAPDSKLTKAQFIKLLTVSTGLYDAEKNGAVHFADVKDDAWYKPYVYAGICGMILDGDGSLFEPDTAIRRGEAAVWIYRATGIESDGACSFSDVSAAEEKTAVAAISKLGVINGYEDGTFRPDMTLSRAEGAAIISRLMNLKSVNGKPREESANEIVLKESVKQIEIGDETKIDSVDSKSHSITFSTKDESILNLKSGDVVFINPCDKLADGALLAVKSIKSSKSGATVTFASPKIDDAIESIDISAVVGASLADAQSGGYTAVGGLSAKSDTSASAGAEISLKNGKLAWKLSANGKTADTLHFETDGYAKKQGAYAAADIKLTAFVDIMFSGSMTSGSFYAHSEAQADADLTVGYAKGASKEISKELPAVNVPVCGPVSVKIQPYLVMTANGSFKVEAKASLSENVGFLFDNGDFEKWSRPSFDASLTADADGKIESGIKLNTDITVGNCGIIGLDGIEIAGVGAEFGVGVNGKTAVSQKVNVSKSGTKYEGNQNTPDKNGVIHNCYLCIEGMIYGYSSFSAGLSEDLNKYLKEHKMNARYEGEKEEVEISPWHYSTGDWGGPEFELKNCGHKKIRVSGTVTDAETKKAISGASVTCSDESVLTDASGKYEIFVPAGANYITASAEKHKKKSQLVAVTDKEKTADFVLDEAKCKICGYVYDAKTGMAAGGITVMIGDKKTVSDANGYYSLEIDAAPFTLTASGEGCNTVTASGDVTGSEIYVLDIYVEIDKAVFAKKAYADYLKKLKNPKEYRFALIYIDGDDIPELAIVPDNGAHLIQVSLYTYKDNSVLPICIAGMNNYNGYGAYATIWYRPKTGKIVAGNGMSRGNDTLCVYYMNGTVSSLSDRITAYYGRYGVSYTYNDVNISEAYYNTLINSANEGCVELGYDSSVAVTNANIKSATGF